MSEVGWIQPNKCHVIFLSCFILLLKLHISNVFFFLVLSMLKTTDYLYNIILHFFSHTGCKLRFWKFSHLSYFIYIYMKKILLVFWIATKRIKLFICLTSHKWQKLKIMKMNNSFSVFCLDHPCHIWKGDMV